ncbi:MAG: response regulator [Patescibacteria group bacterium]
MGDEKKYGILIVDDDNFLLDMYAIKFRESGFSVETLGESTRVVAALKGNPAIDAVLLDIVMPQMDGFQVLQKIKEDKELSRVLVIMLSNLGQEQDIKRATELGADGYIIKANVTPKDVVEKVKTALAQKNTG